MKNIIRDYIKKCYPDFDIVTENHYSKDGFYCLDIIRDTFVLSIKIDVFDLLEFMYNWNVK